MAVRSRDGFHGASRLLGGALAALALGSPACGHPTQTEPRPEAITAPAPGAASTPGLAAAPASGPARFVETLDVSVFQRGNLHSHTSRSDGDRPPEETYAWYRDHGYAFVAITDHNQLTPPEEYRSFERKGFAMLPGEEITMLVQGHPVTCTSARARTARSSTRRRSSGMPPGSCPSSIARRSSQ